ncbi:CARDB domain-containing protein [Trichlorobacter lovleyi]|uniref:CARDB domain-containing protein n=1 Tax=Trichlorobacter lovleyi TaxID=313985 RepID=UPI0024808EB8|nr:CARDB domain-containing protein [Trichlorobacter lovleyi]
MTAFRFLRSSMCQGVVCCLLTLFMSLAVSVCPVLADEFKASHLGDYGNVTVMEVSGGYDAKIAGGVVNAAPRQAIAKEFFRLHKDEYDFLVIFTNFDFNMLDADTLGFYTGVKNNITGIGQEIFDNSALYGSTGRLQGTIDMGNLAGKVSNPLVAGFETTLNVLSHEMQHRWAAYVKFKNADGTISTALLGKDGAHWSFKLDSKASLMYGNQWQDNGNGTFTALAARNSYSPLDLYLMGMLDKSKVPPMLLIENPSIDPAKLPEPGTVITGTARYVTIEDIIAAEGERTPSAAVAPKQFKMAFVYAVNPGTFNPEALLGIENVRNGFLTRYSILTDGKGLVQVASTLKDEFVNNPGVRPPIVVPRSLPPNIDNGVTWLTGHQQADGSWYDLSLTAERDTAEVVSTLQRFPSALQAFQAGFSWLGAASSVNTDYLSRRIETLAKSAGDNSALLNALLANRNSDGGWGAGKNYLSTPIDTALALKALAVAGYADASVISKAVSYLQSSQNSDGGWSGDDPASTIQPTASVLTAFAGLRGRYALDNAISKAQAFLASKQNQDGGFGNSPSTVYDSAVAIGALQVAGTDSGVTSRGVSYLLSEQSENGSWLDSPYQTALAVQTVWLATVTPDLSVKSEDISIIPTRITSIPTTAVLSVKVSNLGRTDVPQAGVSVYDGGITADKKVAEQVAAFPGQSSVTLTFAIPVNDSKAHNYYVVVDQASQINESNKTNNTASLSLMPEITYDFKLPASDVTVTPNPVDMGKEVKIAIKVANSGTSDAYNVPIRVFIDQQGAPLEIALLTVDIPAGGSASKETVWKASRAGTDMPLTIQVDPNNLFSETNKDDNRASIPLTVNASVLPNLSVSYKNMIVTPNPAREGGSASISVLVKNDGYAAVQNAKVNVYLGVADNGGILLGSQVIPSIAAGQEARAIVNWTGIAVNGNQMITVQVDPDNALTEILKDDNFTFLNLDVLSLPDLAISTNSILLTPSAPKTGDQISIAVTVQNAGDQEVSNVAVQVKEGSGVIGTAVIPLINGNTQATGNITYTNAGQNGSHPLSVTVDPEGLVIERTKDNNSATKTFSIQNADLWLTEPYISPDNDGTKDVTDFSFRLATPTKVTVRVINKRSVAVRTFSGGELDNTAGTTITWDGKNDAGAVVSDGTYQIQVVATTGAVLAQLPVEVDTNRSPLAEAVGTKYLLQSNQTCMLPSYDRMTWMPNESGLVFQLYPAQDSPYLEGLYAMSPTGEDILRLIPGLWNSTTDPNTTYDVSQWDMTQDGQRIALVLIKSEKQPNGSWNRWASLWTVDTDGSNLTKQYDFVDVPFGPEKIKWSPDGTKIAIMKSGLYIFNPSTKEMKYAASQGYTFSGQMEWLPDSSMVYAFSYNYNYGFSLSDPNGVGNYYQDAALSYGGNALGWIWDKKIVFAGNDGQVMQFDAQTGTFSVLPGGVSADLLTKSPDRRYLAWAESEWKEAEHVWGVKQLSIMDSSQKTTAVTPSATASDVPFTGITLRYVWAADSSALAYINTRYNSLDKSYSDELVIHDMAAGTDRRVEVNKYICQTTNPEIPQSVAFNNYSGSISCFAPNKITKIVAWMKDKVNFLLETSEGIFSFNSDDQTSSDFLPLDWANFVSFSPSEHYLAYEDYSDANSGCFPKWQNQWVMSSLLNLTADLRIAKTKTFTTLRGIASDKNFDGYRLEYADLKSPGTWNLIAPPSSVPVLNNAFTVWVPPYEGSFLVRLTVWDKAGNQAVDRKRLNWGMSSLITNLYKTEEYISPNGDGNKETVELHYQVLEPVHLEFNVYDANNTLVRNYSRDHTEATSDFIAWDGKDATGKVVPDGRYRIAVFDYDFFVTVDATLPNIAVEWGRLELPKSVEDPYIASVKLFGLISDLNIRKWGIEYGVGDNPQAWVALKTGNDSIGGLDNNGKSQNTKLTHFEDEEIGILKGARIRVTAEDYAGNQSSMLSNFVEERFEIFTWDSKSMVAALNAQGLLLSTSISARPHEVSGVETYRLRTIRRVLQYQSGGQWIDSVVQDVHDANGHFRFVWDAGELNVNLITALRIKIIDESGGIHYKTVGIDREFKLLKYCNMNIIIVNYDLSDELETLLLQFSYDNGKTWKNIKNIVGRSDEIDLENVVPQFDITKVSNYQVRVVATTIDGVVRTKSLQLSPEGCSDIGLGVKIGYDKATICNTLAPGTARIEVLSGHSGSVKIESLRLHMKAPEGDRLLKDFGASLQYGSVFVGVDTSGFPEGSYPVTATLAYSYLSEGMLQHGVMTRNASVVVSHTLPQVRWTHPSEDSGQAVCPTRIKSKYGVNLAGIATSVVGVGHYDVVWGSGASPSSWHEAQRVSDGFKISGDSSLGGNLDTWDVSGLKGDTYSLQLQAYDKVGNKACSTSTFYLNEPVKITSITPSRPLISSVSGYSVDAGYQLTGPATVGVKVFPVIDGKPETLGEPALRNIASDVRYLGGIEYTSWDGTKDGGSILPDGKYGLAVTSLDACQLPDVKWAKIEIDNTPPVAAIGYPRPADPLPVGNIIEVRVTAMDQHFMSYLLEVGEGADPASWLMLKSGTRTVSNEKIVAWNTYGLKDVWTLRLTAFDTAGNTSVVTSTINLGARKDLIKTFTVTPDLFSPNNDQKRDTTHVSYEVTDACQIKFDILNEGGSSVKNSIVTTGAAGKGSFDWDGMSATNQVVADGVYTVRMYASLAGKPEVNQTETLTLTIDKVAPQILIPIPADKAYYNKTELPVSGSITDQNLNSYTVTVAGPSGTVITDAGNQNRSGYSFGTIGDLVEDSYTLTATADDLAENQTKLVRTFTIDRTSPKTTLDTPLTGGFYGGSKSVIEITGNIVEKNLDLYSLRYGVGEAPTEWKEVVGGNTLPTTTKLATLKVGKSDGVADGVYTLSLYAKDKAGLSGETKLKLVVDNTLPEVALTAPRDGDYLTKAVDVKGSLNDSNLAKGVLELSEGSCLTASKWSVIKNFTTTVSSGLLDSWKLLPADGEYCLRLAAEDKSENKTETKVGFRIDTVPPLAPQLTGKVDNKVDAQVTWSKNTESDLAGYNLYRNSQKVNTALLADTTYRDPALKEGTYVYSVKAVDLAGNESVASNEISLKVDLSGPSVRISTPKDGSAIANLVDIKGTAYSQDDFKEYRVFIGKGSSPSAWSEIRRSPLPLSFGTLAQMDSISLTEGEQYSIKLEGEDLSGNISTHQIQVTIDNTPPKAPLLLAAAASSADVAVSWKVSSEADLAGYLLYRNDQLANVKGIVAGNLKPYLVVGTSYADKALPDGTYRYTLFAMDQAGNTSDQSNELEVTIDTHPPHMTITEPAGGLKFEQKLTIKAESPDNDIARVQFQYKRTQDTAWTDLGTAFVKSPYITYFDPKTMGLSYGNYQLQALATDKKGNVDPAPQTVEVTYADLTPPVMLGGLAAKVNGAAVSLSWTASTESDLDGYNVYRILSQENSRIKANTTLLKQPSYSDGAVPDGSYDYEVTAVDTLGNESKASEQVAARVYAPVVTQLFTPVKNSAATVAGTNATPNSSAVITTVSPTGQITATTVLADASGSFKMDGVTLALGENRYTAVATDAQGNISRTSETMVVVYDTPPTAPTGLAATVQSGLVGLTWNPNGEADILGYNVYLKGHKVNAGAVVSGGQATASYEYYPAQNAVEGYDGYWQSPYTDGVFSPVWWQVTLPSKELINRVNVFWGLGDWDDSVHKYNLYAGSDFELQAWSGYAWVTLKKFSANQEQDNWIDISPAYRTDKIRLKIDSTTDTDYSKLVRINEVRIWKDNLVATPSYNHMDYEASGYAYTVTAVDSYGFESEPSGYYDVVPPSTPANLSATAQGSSITLSWSLTGNAEPDLAGFNLYRKSGQDWIKIGSTSAVIKTYADADLKNGEYYYRVTAFDLAGNESLPSNEAVATVKVAVPTVPVALVVSVIPTGRALLASWQAAGGTVAYNLYRSTTSGVGYLRVNATPITALSYIDRGLTNGITYYYVVVATDDVGNESPYSNEAVGMPQRSLTLQPSILYPTVAGVPTTVYQNKVDLAGIAEPGMQVDIFHGDSVQDSVSTSVEPKQTDKVIVTDNINRVSENAALTQDGKYLAYQVDQYLLQIQNLVDGSVVDVPVPAGVNYYSTAPKWSPDGRYLVTVADWSAHKIVVYDRETATYRLIAIGEFSNGYGEPSWSADSKEILFMSYNTNFQLSLWSANIASAVATRLTADGVGGYYPQFSPAANKIAFFKGNALYLFDRRDNSTLLIDDNTDGYTVSWSPDASSRLAFISYRDDERGRVYLYNPDNGEISRYSSSQDYPWGLSWSPDGKQMGVVSYNDESSQLILSVINLYGLEEPLYTLDDSMDGLLVGPQWLSSGELAVVDDKGAHYIQPAGYFKSAAISLFAGENYLHAVSKDNAGNISQPSDSITVVYDTGRLPDLVIASDDLSIYPQFPKPGEDVLVTARIHNPTNNAVDNVPVSFYLWNGSDDVALVRAETVAHIDANGEESVAFKFNVGSVPATNSLIAYVDPENTIAEVVETNNSSTKDFVVTSQQKLQLESVLDNARYAANQDVLISVAVMNSGSATSGVLRVTVEDSSGNLVKILKEEQLDLPFGLNTKQTFVWNTAVNYSGEYTVHTVVKDGTETSVLAEISSPFSIVPDLKVSGGLTVGKQEYLAGEDAVLGISYANTGSNYLIPSLTSRIRIVDLQGTQLFSDEKTFANALPAAGGTYSVYWNTGGVTVTSSYTATLEIVVDGQVRVTQSVPIRVAVPAVGRLNLLAVLKVASPAMSGGSVPVSYTVTNKGSAPATGTLRVSLLDPDTQYVIASFEQPGSIGGNAAISGSSTFSASSLALKAYHVVLQYITDATIQTLAKSTVVVKDGIAPAISVLSPVQGTRHTKEVLVSAIVTDDASGVERVEYVIDGGIWQALALVDPAKGLYHGVWLVPENADGQHLIAFKATDKAGNSNQPITIPFAILNDNTPPVLTVSALADGAYTNSDVLNISGVVTDEGGIRELKVNDLSVPVDQDGSFTYALSLKSGANFITIVATDLSGNQSSNNRTINLDQAAPLLAISTPADNSKTALSLIDVTGTVDESSTVVLKLGGVEQPITMNNKDFTSSVTLVPGINTIEVTATDVAGNTSAQKRTVVYDDQKPALAVTSPVQDIRTNKSDATILGTVSDPYTSVTVSILFEGMTYTPAVVNGQFEQQITFTTEKSYPVVVTASNEVGTTTTVQRNIIYDITPPGLTINPVITPTQSSEQIVSGTREVGTTVTLTCPTAVVSAVEYPTEATWRVAVTNLAVGENTITATAIDETGNTTTVLSKITVIIPSDEPLFSYAVFGNVGVVLSGTASTDSYNPQSVGHRKGQDISYESCPRSKNGHVATNSVSPCSIQLHGRASILGKALVGNGGNPLTGVCQTWGTSVSGIGSLAKAKDMKPMIDPGGGQTMGALNLTSHGKKKLAGGIYRFTAISVSGSAVLTLSGKTTIYIDGNFSVSGNAKIDITPDASVIIFVNGARVDIGGGAIVNQSKNPRNLIVYGSAGLKKINLSACTVLYGLIYAPAATINISGNQQTYGSVVGNAVNLSGNGAVHYDETLANHD